MKKTGTVVAVCRSLEPGLPKYSQDYILINPYGVSSDYHSNPMRVDFKNPGGPRIPNTDRHILIVAEEALVELNKELNLNLKAGDLGENILVRGFGNLSDIQKETLIEIRGGSIVLKVTKQNKPCINTTPIHPMFNSTVYNKAKGVYRRGLLCSVESGVGLFIRPGDEVEI